MLFHTSPLIAIRAASRAMPSSSTHRQGPPSLPSYDVVDLGVLPKRTTSEARAINDYGVIVGSSGLVSPWGAEANTPFVYRNGTMAPATTMKESAESVAVDIDSHGTVAVDSLTQKGFHGTWHAYLWKDGAATEIAPPTTYTGCFLTGMNDAGAMIGWCQDAKGNNFGFVRRGGVTKLLHATGKRERVSPMAINNRGQIAGTVSVSSSDEHSRAFILDRDHMTLIGSPAGGTGAAGINNLGQVVGTMITSLHDAKHNLITHGFLWDKAHGFTDIGSLGGTYTDAHAVNDKSVIVGSSQIAGSIKQHACIWIDGRILDLNKCLAGKQKQWLLEAANAINNKGQIVGIGLIGDKAHAFLLTPHAPVNAPQTAGPR